MQPGPAAAPAAAPSLQEKLSKLVRSTAKAAAILGVAVALVSVPSKICTGHRQQLTTQDALCPTQPLSMFVNVAVVLVGVNLL